MEEREDAFRCEAKQKLREIWPLVSDAKLVYTTGSMSVFTGKPFKNTPTLVKRSRWGSTGVQTPEQAGDTDRRPCRHRDMSERERVWGGGFFFTVSLSRDHRKANIFKGP